MTANIWIDAFNWDAVLDSFQAEPKEKGTKNETEKSEQRYTRNDEWKVAHSNCSLKYK